MAQIVELIYTHDLRGTGKEGDPYRRVYQLFTKDGELVAEHDTHDESKNYVDTGKIKV